MLTDYELTLQPIAPYTAAGAAQRALSTEMLESAFALGENRYFSDAYALDNGFGVLIYQGKIDPEIPAFETVAAVVSADYIAEEKRRLFNEKGISLEADLTAKVAEGTSFVEAAEALELKATSYDSFKAAEAPRELNPTVLQKAQSMQAGEVSPMLTTRNGIGTIVYVEEKNVPEIATDSEEFTTAQDFLTRYSAYISSSALTNELIARGIPEQQRVTEAVDAE